jgi:type IV secretion system protein VirD4
MNNRPKDPKTARNKNVLVIGGSGSGKTRFFVKPNQSENRGAQTSHGLNYQKLGKELMSQDEIATMDGGKCILQVRGVRPFFSEKYDIIRHPRYKYLSDADKKNTFDVDSYLSSLRRKKRRVITEDEPFDLYDIELSDEDFAAE